MMSHPDFVFSDLFNNFNEKEELQKDLEEDILDPKNSRLVILPIDPRFEKLWLSYENYEKAFWTSHEVKLAEDKYDYDKLDPNIQHFIKMTFAFFAGADSIVNENIEINFSKITIREAKVAYAFQEMMENIHGQVYANMLSNIIEDKEERLKLIDAFKTIRPIKLMIDWAQKWIRSGRRIAFSIAAFTIFEGLMFSGSFASIYWLKQYLGDNRMKGLVQANNLIAKDEGMHTVFGCEMYSYVKHKLTKDEMNAMLTEAVTISKIFIKDAIKVDMIGMNVMLMDQYIEYVADRLLLSLKYDIIYKTKIPDQFQFMDTIGFLNKDNFFDKRPTEYQRANNSKNVASNVFNLLEDY